MCNIIRLIKPQKTTKNLKKVAKKQKVVEKLRKIPLTVHPLFLALGLFMFMIGRAWLWLIYVILALCHELAHSLVARKLGYKLGKIKLMPFGAVLEADDDEFFSKDEVLIALAGPLFNLLFGVIIIAAWWINPEVYYFTIDLAVANLACGLFNLVPIFPLDGGRVLLALLSNKFERKSCIRVMKIVSVMFGIILFTAFFISAFFSINLTFGFMGLMLIDSAILGDKRASYHKILSLEKKCKKSKYGLSVKVLMLNESISVFKAYLKLSSGAYNIVIIVDDQLNEIGKLTEKQIYDAIVNERLSATLKEELILKTLN